MPVLPRVLFLAAIVTAALSTRADAQSVPAPTQADMELAKQYVDAGIAAQGAADYSTAIAYYRKAYQIKPYPVLLFDMAQAYRLARQTAKALAFYADYLAADPDGSKAPDARAFVSELQGGAAAGTRRSDDARPATQPRPPAQPRRGATRDAEQPPPPGAHDLEAATAPTPVAASPARSPGAEPADPGEASPGRNLRWTALATASLGAVSLAVGAGFGLHGRSLSDEVQKRYDPAKIDEGNRANVFEITGLATGAGLMAVSGALLWWAHVRGSSAEQVTVAPMVSDRLAGLAVSGAL